MLLKICKHFNTESNRIKNIFWLCIYIIELLYQTLFHYFRLSIGKKNIQHSLQKKKNEKENQFSYIHQHSFFNFDK